MELNEKKYTPEEIKENKRKVLARIKSETLPELYWHRQIMLDILACNEAYHRMRLMQGKTDKPATCHDADHEASERKTLQLIESEIAKRILEAKEK